MSSRHHLIGFALAGALVAPLCASSAFDKDTMTAQRTTEESAKANAWFDRVFDEDVDRSPLLQGYLGIKKDNDKWDDFSEERRLEDFARTVQRLAELKRTIRFDWLDEQTQVSYRMFVAEAELAIEGWKWRDHGYVFSQMQGLHTDAPAYLINFHPVETVADARAYVARLRAMPAMFAQLIARAEAQAAKGVLPPKFVFGRLLGSSRDIITGEPFDQSGKPCALLEDITAKIEALKDADAATKKQLLADARAGLLEGVKPAYDKLIALFTAQEAAAGTDDGIWKLPEGRAYYDFMLKVNTTTRLTADEVHELGLREVARIHSEMNTIRTKAGFKGDLAAFMVHTRNDKKFYHPTTPEGIAAYMKEAQGVIDAMTARLDEFFILKPKAPLVLKKVEPFREKGAPRAFYEQPSPDGSRPGAYFVNTFDMSGLPIWEMETLAHHEAIPGHHMQVAIAQELTGIPKFRKFNTGYTAYVEGWALYSEYFPKQFGFYSDIYMDYGQLADELLRAVRLVVDTGLHARKWTRQQVIDYFRANTPQAEVDIVTETERYIVIPGQATAYKVGMLKILGLREEAKKELGAKFDIRSYHDLVLKNGALPLDLLEENVRAWVKQQKG